MILSGQSIRDLEILYPFCERKKWNGTTFGLGPAGYDVRLILSEDRNVKCYNLRPGEFLLAATQERFKMPENVLGVVHDKSSWARRGVTVQNTVIEPGWRGYLTLELSNISQEVVTIYKGQGIAQVIFHFTDKIVEMPYDGKYQDQEFGPQQART